MPAPGSTPTLPPTSYAILGLVATCGEVSGYDLKQFADQSISHFYWAPAKSQVYSELRRLAAHGYVRERQVEQEARPDKRTYAITPEGRTALNAWIERPDEEPEVFKSHLLLKLFLGVAADTAALLAKVRRYGNEAGERRKALLEAYEHVKERPEMFYISLTIRAGLLHAEAALKWADEAVQSLEAKTAKPPRPAPAQRQKGRKHWIEYLKTEKQ